MSPLERLGIVVGVFFLIVVPFAVHGWPTTLDGNAFVGLMVCGGLALLWWRTRPRVAAVLALGAFLASFSFNPGWFPDSCIGPISFSFAVVGLAWSGRAAWLAAVCAAAYLVPFYYLSDNDSPTAALMFTVPPFIAGTVLRLRQETADQLTMRASELEDERELFAEIALRHERARIASELHDIVGHAISVMVIQAAAGQRLVDKDPVRAQEALVAISESARQGAKDLERLVDLLAGSEGETGAGPDLWLVDEVVARAGRSGLNVTCRFEGDRDGVSKSVAHTAFRVVQESLTNALRYAPGADVHIVISVDQGARGLAVRVENGRGTPVDGFLSGTGRGLIGLRERVQTLGGQFSAGPTAVGGWAVWARLPGATAS